MIGALTFAVPGEEKRAMAAEKLQSSDQCGGVVVTDYIVRQLFVHKSNALCKAFVNLGRVVSKISNVHQQVNQAEFNALVCIGGAVRGCFLLQFLNHQMPAKETNSAHMRECVSLKGWGLGGARQDS